MRPRAVLLLEARARPPMSPVYASVDSCDRVDRGVGRGRRVNRGSSVPFEEVDFLARNDHGGNPPDTNRLLLA